jgi:hypothetical protein
MKGKLAGECSMLPGVVSAAPTGTTAGIIVLLGLAEGATAAVVSACVSQMFELHGWDILDQEAVREAEPGAAAAGGRDPGSSEHAGSQRGRRR